MMTQETNWQSELHKLVLKDSEHNLSILSKIKSSIDSGILKDYPSYSSIDFAYHLYKPDIDDNWKKAQCQSINNQIEKMLTGKIKFLSADVTREFLYDISSFNQKTQSFECENNFESTNFLTSMDFFLNAKFSYTDKYNPVPLNGRHFTFANTPALIRQAIEIKVKNMIGIHSIVGKNNKPTIISISDLLDFLDFLEKYEKLHLPTPIGTLKSINNWTNQFIHTGIMQYSWQSLEAIDLIEPMFAIEDSKGIYHEGFNYLNDGYSKDQLKEDLDAYFCNRKVKFNLYSQEVEGRVFCG